MAGGAASGFNMKGNAWRGIQEYMSRQMPGGNENLLARLTPETSVFVQQQFIPSVWYDVLPVDEVTRVAARLLGVAHETLCRGMGTYIYQRDMTGLYRTLLKFATADLMVKALPLATKRYFDFIGMEVHRIARGSFDVHLSGIPESIAATYVNVTSVFIESTIRGSGGENVSAHTLPPVPGPVVRGVRTVQIVRQLRWQ